MKKQELEDGYDTFASSQKDGLDGMSADYTEGYNDGAYSFFSALLGEADCGA